MATPRAAEHKDLEQRLRNIEGALHTITSTTLRRQPIQVGSAQVDRVIASPPAGAWTELEGTDVAVPQGYTRALVSMYVAHGLTFPAGGGNVGVQPVCNGVGGPAISTGTLDGIPLSVVSYGAFVLNEVSGHVNLDVMVVRQGNPLAGSENIHISASVIFLR